MSLCEYCYKTICKARKKYGEMMACSEFDGDVTKYKIDIDRRMKT